MENNLKKFIASLMLTAFVFSNSLLTVSAMENAKPVLRDNEKGFSMKLKGDINYIKSKTPVSISLRDSDVKQVLRMFADKAGMNIVFHDSVDGKVTLDLVDVPLNKAFDMIMSINNLNYVVDDNTIFVAKSGTSNFNIAKQDMTLIPVKYVGVGPLAEFLNTNIFGMNKPGLSNSNVVSTNPANNELIIFGNENDVSIARKIVEKFDKKPTTTTFKVNHTTPEAMANMICNMLIPATGANKGSNGGGGGGMSSGGEEERPSEEPMDDFGRETGGAAGIMTGGAISLNSGSVACTLNSSMNGSLNLQNMSISYFPQLGTINVVGGSESQLEMIKEFISQTDKKQPQAYLEVSVVELSDSGSKSLQNTWEFLSRTVSARFDGEATSTYDVNPIFVKGPGYAIYDYSDPSNPKLISLRERYNGPVSITYAINYAIKNNKGRVVANPRVIITNGETSNIEITDDYVESVDSDMNTYSGGTYVSRTYNTANDAGIKIEITPFISPDGYVTLNIKPEYATILNTINGSDSYGSYVAATLLSRKNLDLKSVRIKDGETLIIAGMISEEEQKSVSKIPLLGDIPGIGALFRTTTSTKVKKELVLMITPKIITDSEDAIGNTDTL